jgi:predicted lipoprotein with Yx(FWY)xxD motif
MLISTRPRRLVLGAAVAIGTAVMTACGGTTPQPASSSQSSGGGSSGGVTVAAAQTSHGMLLAGPTGNTLYTLTSASGTPLPCSGACLSEWPPLTGTAPVAGSGVTASFSVGTGSQVTVNGDPLYYYVGDTAPGDVNGQGITMGNGTWHAVQSNGQPLPVGSAAGASPTSSSGGY